MSQPRLRAGFFVRVDCSGASLRVRRVGAQKQKTPRVGYGRGFVYSNEKKVVRGRGLEPLHPCGRQDLNLVRLPISPSSPPGALRPMSCRVRHAATDCATATSRVAAQCVPIWRGRKREREILPDRHALVCNSLTNAMLQFSTRRKKRSSALHSRPQPHPIRHPRIP